MGERETIMNKIKKINKEYIKDKNVWKITFRLPKDMAPDAKFVYIVGDFTNWENYGYFMEKLKNGDYAKTLYLLPGKKHRFRYIIDGPSTEEDWSGGNTLINL